MDLRGLSVSGATARDADFACSNFARADFSRATLTTAWFKAADLTDADFSGANLEDACFYNANVKRAKFNGTPNTGVLRSALRNACISLEGEGDKKEIISDSKEIRDLGATLAWCSGPYRCEQSQARVGCPATILEND
jgi:hypothetical protein